MTELFRLTAREMVAVLRRGEASPLEAVDAALARIEAVDGAVNALPTLCAERARAQAQGLATGKAERDSPAWLAGLPIAVKDLTDVAGVRTTYGSTVFADHVPVRSDVLVETLEARGAIPIAKSNTPEFGAGAHTFNDVFGKTRNPWDLSRTCGGSSGGSAVALAAGEVWLATGSDLGGSLRIPAGFCSVVGLRPSPGRVARAPTTLPFDALSVAGPMGRTVCDVALMLDAMVGPHPRDPIALPAPALPFQAAVEAPTPPTRVAFSPDLGVTPVAAEIREICAAAAARFGELGATVEEACPDLGDAREIFQVLRAHRFAASYGAVYAQHKDALKPEVVWNVERGLALSSDEIGRAEIARARLYARMAAFFETYDLLLCPTTAIPPFDIDMRYPDEIEGQRLETYIDWFAVTYAITLTASPALSLPCGFTAQRLPVGLQMVGRPRAEASLLAAAALAEELFGVAAGLPIDPVSVTGPGGAGAEALSP
ncbi:MAG TPA: amidase family protein [Rhodospirillales bacterium]|nr:amidase family protein [Rhodospirillales bacterium]